MRVDFDLVALIYLTPLLVLGMGSMGSRTDAYTILYYFVSFWIFLDTFKQLLITLFLDEVHRTSKK